MRGEQPFVFERWNMVEVELDYPVHGHSRESDRVFLVYAMGDSGGSTSTAAATGERTRRGLRCKHLESVSCSQEDGGQGAQGSCSACLGQY